MRKSIKIKNYEEALEKGYIVAGDFMCNKTLYKKYLDGLTDD